MRLVFKLWNVFVIVKLTMSTIKMMKKSQNNECIFSSCARTNQVREITFKLNTSLSLYCESKPSLSDDRNVKQIKMTFDSFEADDVEKLVLYMVRNCEIELKWNVIKFLKKLSNNSSTTSL